MDLEEYIENQKKLNDYRKLIIKHATIKDCSHPSKHECRLPIKSAHSLQRQGALKYLEAIKNKNACVYCHSERQFNKSYHFLDLKPIGRKEASTFFGFCDFHDTEIFKNIENDPDATDIENDEHCFLHTYRSFSHSFHKKYEELKLYSSKDMEIVNYFQQAYGHNKRLVIEGIKLALKDLEEPKRRIDKLLLEKKYNGLHYLCYEFPYRCPVACSGVSTPGHYKNGDIFNLSEDGNTRYSDIFTTVLPLKEKTVIILACFNDDFMAIKYLDEIENIKDEEEFQKYLSFHIINNLENTYISPKFYDRKNIKWQKKYCQIIDVISDKYQHFLKFNKKFPINYFKSKESI